MTRLSHSKLKALCKKIHSPGQSVKACMRKMRDLQKPQGQRKIKSCSSKDPVIRGMISTAQRLRAKINSGEIDDTNGRADSASYYIEDMQKHLRKRCGRKAKGMIKKMYR